MCVTEGTEDLIISRIEDESRCFCGGDGLDGLEIDDERGGKDNTGL